jgi:hypothetical protein
MKNLGDAQLKDNNGCGLSFFTSRCFLILVILNAGRSQLVQLLDRNFNASLVSKVCRQRGYNAS